jgi:hypothetical protein
MYCLEELGEDAEGDGGKKKKAEEGIDGGYLSSSRALYAVS